jgi:DNA-binding HxlR family transcriptional regulator
MIVRNILFVALRCNSAKIAQGGTILSDTHIDVCEGGHSPEERRAFAEILSRIGDKWTVLVVGALSLGPMRYRQIFKLVDGVSQRMLTLTLKSLERDGLVTRTVYPTKPPRVAYELTERGKTLIVPLHLLWKWAQANRNAIEGARRDFDQQQSKDGAAA